MHKLVGNTEYRIVTVTLACQNALSRAYISDGLNEMLNSALIDPNGCVFDDWAIDTEGPVVKIEEDPEEGEVFSR